MSPKKLTDGGHLATHEVKSANCAGAAGGCCEPPKCDTPIERRPLHANLVQINIGRRISF